MKSDAFQLGDIAFDLNTATLSDKDGQPVPLRNKSKAVLIYLLERRNRTVTKTEILDSVWADVTVSDESLVQCIADIRRLIGADARQIVETVPREGYRLNAQEPKTRKGPRSFVLPVAAAVVLAVVAFWFYREGERSPFSEPLPARVAETQAAPPPGTKSTEAYLEVLQGRVSAGRFGQDESLSAERHFRRAIAIDPNYARAYAELGTLLAVRFENDWNVLEEADKSKALFYAKRAAELDPDLWLAHYALGRLYSVLEDFGASERHLEAAMSLQPENEDARAYYAVVMNLQGRSEEAIEILEPVVRSHPSPPFWYYFALGHALFNAQRFEDAEQALTRCLDLAGNSPYCLRYLIGTLGELERHDEARAAGEKYVSLGFELAVEPMLELVRFHHSGDRERLRSALRHAGVPE